MLVYLEEESVQKLKTYFRSTLANFVLVDYEMFNPDDAFGRRMVINFGVNSPGERHSTARHRELQEPWADPRYLPESQIRLVRNPDDARALLQQDQPEGNQAH